MVYLTINVLYKHDFWVLVEDPTMVYLTINVLYKR